MAEPLPKISSKVIKFMLMSIGLWKIKHVNNFMPLFTKKPKTFIDRINKVNEIYVVKMIYFGNRVLLLGNWGWLCV